MSELAIQVEKRERTGKGGNRKARSRGLIPAVVYGSGKDSVPIQIDRRTFIETMKKSDSENPIFRLTLSGTGQERYAMIREMQRDPVSRQVIHIDFQRIEMTQKVRFTVPIELVGTPVGVKTEGGMMDFVTREVEVECLPADVPAHIELDVTEIHVGQHVEARALTMPDKVVLVDDPDKVILSLGHARKEEDSGAEGTDRAEPEVIKRGKTEED